MRKSQIIKKRKLTCPITKCSALDVAAMGSPPRIQVENKPIDLTREDAIYMRDNASMYTSLLTDENDATYKELIDLAKGDAEEEAEAEELGSEDSYTGDEEEEYDTEETEYLIQAGFYDRI